ncbi:hypothetical protein L7F22_024719 [Adiantum nelumboides]|nr:hypothetical protein [Adiantum nelumboides]
MSYQEISDWERNTPSEKGSSWSMTSTERVVEGKFTHCHFPIEIYELMNSLFGLDKVVNPTTTVIVSSNGLSCRGSIGSPVVGDPSSNTTTFDKNPSNGGVGKKSRKRTHNFDVCLAEATKDLMHGWELAEEGKKQRHEKSLELQHSQHEELANLERQKLEVSLLFANGIQGMVAAMKTMADKL